MMSRQLTVNVHRRYVQVTWVSHMFDFDGPAQLTVQVTL